VELNERGGAKDFRYGALWDFRALGRGGEFIVLFEMLWGYPGW
jgi:hypothetical protein